MTGTMSAIEARRAALAAQGLSATRPSRPDVLGLMTRLHYVQLDAVNVLERTQFLVPFSRLGPYDRSRLTEANLPMGPWWEYYGHAASWLAADDHRWFRWRMPRGGMYFGGPAIMARRAQWVETHRRYLDAVLAEVSERGALTAGALSDPKRNDGEWWERRSLGRSALEHLASTGVLCGYRTPSFERVYDLPERVVRPEALAAPTPTLDESIAELLVRSAAAQGVGTLDELCWYFYVPPKLARPILVELVAGGLLEQVAVEGWDKPGFRVPGGSVGRTSRRTATLLSPFDPLITHRARTSRMFGFDYTIEIYVPAAKRRYGYFCLPVLIGDQLVGRVDLKADRKGGRLLVQAAWSEPGRVDGAATALLADELAVVAEWLGLSAVVVADTGDWASALAADLTSSG